VRLPEIWGVSAEEMTAGYHCDEILLEPSAVWFRAVTVKAPRAVVFRWLCQMKVGPYSYDLLDNFGRRSPRRLTPGTERLDVGQQVMTIFELVAFETNEQLTLRMRSERGLKLFGDFAISYVVRDHGRQTRLVVKLLLGKMPGPFSDARRRALAWGDLFMMRRQLLTFRNLAERDSATLA
jgi:hypothetical protein